MISWHCANLSDAYAKERPKPLPSGDNPLKPYSLNHLKSCLFNEPWFGCSTTCAHTLLRDVHSWKLCISRFQVCIQCASFLSHNTSSYIYATLKYLIKKSRSHGLCVGHLGRSSDCGLRRSSAPPYPFPTSSRNTSSHKGLKTFLGSHPLSTPTVCCLSKDTLFHLALKIQKSRSTHNSHRGFCSIPNGFQVQWPCQDWRSHTLSQSFRGGCPLRKSPWSSWCQSSWPIFEDGSCLMVWF